MGMKVEEAGKKRLFAIGLPLYQALVRPIHDGWRFWQGSEWMVPIIRPNRCSTWEERQNSSLFIYLKAATDSLSVILTSCMQGCSEIPLQLPGPFILCSVVFQLPYSFYNIIKAIGHRLWRLRRVNPSDFWVLGLYSHLNIICLCG